LPDHLFLPDFCARDAVFTVVVAGEVMAFVLVLAPGRVAHGFLGELALVSLFVQWLGLSSAGLLCALRPRLSRLGNVAAGLVAHLLVVVVALVLGEAALYVVPLARDVGHVEFQVRNLALSAIVAAVVLRYLYVQHQWRIQVESESRARIQALQSRIRPHFLFNSMNTIASLARTDPALAEQVTEDLADLFRASLGDASVTSTLGAELDLCRRYLHIEAQRLGPRLRIEYQVDELPRALPLPALTLQPLVENAVYHGIEQRTESGLVRIEGSCDQAALRVSVINSSAGRCDTQREGNRMALDNVGERLRAHFGERIEIDIDDGVEEYRVTIKLPRLEDQG